MTTKSEEKEDICTWICRDPCSKWPLFYFLAIFGMSLALLLIAYYNYKTTWLPGGIGALVTAVFGIYHFRTLLALMDQVYEYIKLNKEMKIANSKLKIEIDKLQQAEKDLVKSQESLNQSNAKNKENLEKFEKLSNNLETMGKNSSAGLDKIAKIAKSMKVKWKNKLAQKKRNTFMKVFDQMEFEDDKDGMTKDEYNKFLHVLPEDYRNHLIRADTFNTLAGNDNVVDIDEFRNLIDSIEDDLKQIPTIPEKNENVNEIDESKSNNTENNNNADHNNNADNNNTAADNKEDDAKQETKENAD